MDVELVQKGLKTLNLTTTNVILMKITTIFYLHKEFDLTKTWAVAHRG